MKHKQQITFSKKYQKLKRSYFTTIRWLDSIYRLGKIYPVFVVGDNLFHNRYGKEHARVVQMELVTLDYLTDEQIFTDAECEREEFFELMKGWYSKKPDWKGWDSEAQLLTLLWDRSK